MAQRIEGGLEGPWDCYQGKHYAKSLTLSDAAPEMLKVGRTIERVANVDVSVMLLGASGTGKELLARGLHNASARRDRGFVAINCAAIPENLLEAELFGHEKGAFTGAIKTTEGKIELAHGGTLFLDEIGDVPLPLQVKLLRFLQERVIERIGGRKPIAVDTRIVCATHQDLQAMIGKAETALESFAPEEINDCAGRHLDLQIGPRRLAFTSETFILSFSLPNFHFHAVTAYNILRSRGVPLGKRDYEGRLRTSSF